MAIVCPPSPPSVGADDYIGRAAKAGANYMVIFTPVVATADEYEDLINAERMGPYEVVILREKCGFVKFRTNTAATRFIHHFSGFLFRGQPMRCEMARVMATPGEKSIKLTGIPETGVTERDIYNAIKRFGFLRRVAIKGDKAFVDFDTSEEAMMFLSNNRSITINGNKILIENLTNEDIQEGRKMGVPLSAILPLDNPLWFKIQEMLCERKLKSLI